MPLKLLNKIPTNGFANIMNYSKVLTKSILVIASISGCNGADLNVRSSYVSTNSDVCVDTSTYIKYWSSGSELTFTCHPGAVASIIDVDKNETGYIVLCTCRDTKPEGDIQEPETE
jgi:hypothetical protein